MQISVILAHPDDKSLNHAIAQTTISELEKHKHKVYYHNLYQENFNPILRTDEIPVSKKLNKEIELYCLEMSASDGVVIIHPNWWGQPPAILKGWIDRVIRPGIAYQFLEGDKGEGIPKGLWKGKIGIVFNTSNTNAEREQKVFGDPLETLWKNCIFGLCGIEDYYRKMFSMVITSSIKQRKKWLQEVSEVIKEKFPET